MILGVKLQLQQPFPDFTHFELIVVFGMRDLHLAQMYTQLHWQCAKHPYDGPILLMLIGIVQ